MQRDKNETENETFEWISASIYSTFVRLEWLERNEIIIYQISNKENIVRCLKVIREYLIEKIISLYY